MKPLRLRQLAKPLDEARKDPECGAAALFVERLLGRPMRSNAGVILVGDENRETYLGCVDHDFPPRRPMFSPFSFLLGEEMRARTIPEGAEMFGFEDALRPARAHERYKQLELEAAARLRLGEVGGRITPQSGIFMKWGHPTYGLHIGEFDLVVCPSHDAGTLVHELIHAEDRVLFGIPRTLLDAAITEGRATFGGELFRKSQNPERSPYGLELESLAFMARAILKVGPGVFMKTARDKGLDYAAAEFADFIRSMKKNAVDRTSIHYQLIYLPYALALMELSHATGDPFEAFRISTQKPPAAWKQIFMAGEYYRAEAEAVRRRAPNEAGAAPAP